MNTTACAPRQPLPPRSRLIAAATVALAVIAAMALYTSAPSSANTQPNFLLPWQDGQAWLTGSAGFHGTNNALDFFPPDTPLGGGVKCEGDPDWVYQESSYYVLSSAAGEVITAGNAMVLIDHGNGWLSRHYHMTGFVVEAGDYVLAGQRLARPSTLGFCATGPHNHFWVKGPNGETTADVTLSGIPTTQIGPNQWISQTGNHEPPPAPTPSPAPSASPPQAPTITPTPSAPASPTPSPLLLLRGDANCDHVVNALDAIAFLRLMGEEEPAVCNPLTADADCDNAITSADALAVLHSVSGVSALPVEPCALPPSTPPTHGHSRAGTD